MYKIQINNSTYTQWSFESLDSSNDINSSVLNPIINKLFNNDIISIINNKVNIESSPTKINNHLGVLVLENFQTYGKSLYKVIPRDTSLPDFLVKYEIKKSDMGFSKNIANKYIVFKFLNWEGKHPIGQIVETIGPITDLSSFYKYELIHYKLNISISEFNSQVNKIKTIDFEEIKKKYNIENREHCKVFSIDPFECTDFDDAFSISQSKDNYLLSIYISNVPIIIDYLNLWNYFSDRVSTIYLPNRKISMLPSLLADNYCSLKKGETRIALGLDLEIDSQINIINWSFKNVSIKVKYNFVYDSKELLEYVNYKKLFDIVKKLFPSITDSHELVEKLMVLMNNYSGRILYQHNIGIFRSTQQIENKLPEEIKTELQLTSFIGKYTIDYTNLHHEGLQTNSYAHISSPIRRLVDLINMILLIDKNNFLKFKTEAYELYNKWIKCIEFINQTNKKIKKIQSQAQLLTLLTNNNSINTYSGYPIERIYENNCYKSTTIYIPNLRIYSKIKENNLILYQKYDFKFYVFENENKFNKKVKIDLVS